MASFACISLRWLCLVLITLSSSSFTWNIHAFKCSPSFHFTPSESTPDSQLLWEMFLLWVFVLTRTDLNMALFSLLSTRPNHGNWTMLHWCVVRLLISIFRDIIKGWRTPCLEAERQNWINFLYRCVYTR